MTRRPDPAQQRMSGLAFGEPVQATLTGEDVPHRDVLAEQAAQPDEHPTGATVHAMRHIQTPGGWVPSCACGATFAAQPDTLAALAVGEAHLRGQA